MMDLVGEFEGKLKGDLGKFKYFEGMLMCEVVRLFRSYSRYVAKLFKACGSNCSTYVVKLFVVSRDDGRSDGVVKLSEMIHTQ